MCKDCHLSIHIGRANKVGFGEKARKHLAKVNGWTVKETEEHITKAGEKLLHRSGNEYKLDLKWLEQYVPSSEIHLDELKKVGERESLENINFASKDSFIKQEDDLKIEKADLKKAKDDMRKENAALKKWEVALKKKEADMKSRKKHIMKRQGIEEPEKILYHLGSVVRKKSRSEYDKACECEKCKIEYYYEFGESHTAYRITRCNECVKEYGEEYEISNMWTNLDCLLEEKERIRISFFYKKKENGRKENGKTEALIYR